MRAPDRLPAATQQRLGHRRERAKQARAALVRDLAGQSLAQLSVMPARIWDRLGREGVVALIETHRELAHLKASLPPVVAPKSSPPSKGIIDSARERLAHWRAVRPLPAVAAAALLRGTVAATLIGAAALPARELAMETGLLTRPTACPRLDRWTGGCVYTARAEGLSLERIANALGRPPVDLVAANPSLPPGHFLRRGAQIVIPLRPILSIVR